MAVLARADVVLTVHGDRPAGAVPTAALAAGRPPGAERTHPRDDEQRRRARADGRALHEPERVDQAEPQRAEGVPAPALAVHAVGEVRGLPAAEPLDDEARRRSELGGQLLHQHPQPTGAGVGVGDLEQDVGGPAAGHPRRG